MKKSVLKEYAKLIVRTGVNVQKGQTVLVYAGLDQPEFVQMVVEEAYKAKAKEVIVEWSYQPLTKTHVRYKSLKTMSTVYEWEKARLEHYCEVLPARIHLVSSDPDGLKGVNMGKVSKANQATYPILKPYRDRRENKEHCCRSRCCLGKEGVPRFAQGQGSGEALGVHPGRIPCHRGSY